MPCDHTRFLLPLLLVAFAVPARAEIPIVKDKSSIKRPRIDKAKRMDNAALGTGALGANTTGLGNAAVGGNALSSNTSGSSNSAFGSRTLQANTTASKNSAFGSDAL